jgi:hypothetical protein
MISCQVCWQNGEMAQRSNPALQTRTSRKSSKAAYEKSAAYSILEGVNNSADQPIIHTFRLRQSVSYRRFVCARW